MSNLAYAIRLEVSYQYLLARTGLADTAKIRKAAIKELDIWLM